MLPDWWSGHTAGLRSGGVRITLTMESACFMIQETSRPLQARFRTTSHVTQS